MIGLWIEAQDDAVLRRLASVPDGRWAAGRPYFGAVVCTGETSESGCLLCHAFDCQRYGDYVEVQRIHRATELRYMDLCDRFGDARIGHLISERARRVLEERREDAVRETWAARPWLDEDGDPVSHADADAWYRANLLPLLAPEKPAVSVHVSLNCEPVEVGA